MKVDVIEEFLEETRRKAAEVGLGGIFITAIDTNNSEVYSIGGMFNGSGEQIGTPYIYNDTILGQTSHKDTPDSPNGGRIVTLEDLWLFLNDRMKDCNWYAFPDYNSNRSGTWIFRKTDRHTNRLSSELTLEYQGPLSESPSVCCFFEFIKRFDKDSLIKIKDTLDDGLPVVDKGTWLVKASTPIDTSGSPVTVYPWYYGFGTTKGKWIYTAINGLVRSINGGW